VLRALRSALASRLTPWLLLVLTLAGGGAFSLRTVWREVPSPEVVELAGRVQARGREYGRGLALIASGSAVVGKDLLVSATDRMALVVEECRQTPGCDIGFVIGELSAVLDEQRIAIAAARDASGPDGIAPNAVPVLRTHHSPFPAALPEVTRAASLLRGSDLEVLVGYNRRVKRALNDWLTWNRPRLVETYENYVFLRQETAPIYEKADLPEALLFALMAQEASGKVHAYSSAGAAGPLQFMPETGMRYGLGRVDGFDLRLDPVASTRASAKYLTDQLSRFGGDLEMALAAYNGGESRVADLRRKLKGVGFWDPDVYRAIPGETRSYVPAVLAAAWIFLHAEEYDLGLPEAEVGTTEIMLAEDVSIGELTICLSTKENPRGWFRTLRNLNPRLKGNARVPAGERIRLPSMLVPVYVERCVGDAPLLARAREMHDAAYGKANLAEYPVKEGDTLRSIASEIGCASLLRLAGMNGIKGPDYEVRAGQRLTVPECS
jgi:membrane-bound lytic murein transglycosylase D